MVLRGHGGQPKEKQKEQPGEEQPRKNIHRECECMRPTVPEIMQIGGWGDFPGDSGVRNPPANAGDVGLIPGSGRSPGEGSGNPLQYSCLGNSMDRGAWQATVHGFAKSQTPLSELLKTTTNR